VVQLLRERGNLQRSQKQNLKIPKNKYEIVASIDSQFQEYALSIGQGDRYHKLQDSCAASTTGSAESSFTLSFLEFYGVWLVCAAMVFPLIVARIASAIHAHQEVKKRKKVMTSSSTSSSDMKCKSKEAQRQCSLESVDMNESTQALNLSES